MTWLKHYSCRISWLGALWFLTSQNQFCKSTYLYFLNADDDDKDQAAWSREPLLLTVLKAQLLMTSTIPWFSIALSGCSLESSFIAAKMWIWAKWFSIPSSYVLCVHIWLQLWNIIGTEKKNPGSWGTLSAYSLSFICGFVCCIIVFQHICKQNTNVSSKLRHAIGQ